MYYRIAIQRDSAVLWQWKSTVLSELLTVLQFLRLYQALPLDRLRVFSSCSRGELQAQLEQENTGLTSHSVTAAQFLQERRIAPQGAVRETSTRGSRASVRMTSVAVVTEPPPGESDREARPLAKRGVSFLEQKRGELEWGTGGDHGCPYRFTLPGSIPQVLAWVKLLVRVQDGM
jgi:hypothetical protein